VGLGIIPYLAQLHQQAVAVAQLSARKLAGTEALAAAAQLLAAQEILQAQAHRKEIMEAMAVRLPQILERAVAAVHLR
jgi:hypothetical protein